MPSRHRRPPAATAAAVLAARVLAASVLTSSLAGPRLLRAQPVLGAGDDATLPAPGQARARGIATLSAWGSTFAPGARAGLGSNLTTDSLGPTQFPLLRAARDTLRAITGNSALPLSLGRVQVRAYDQVQSVPVIVEVGVTRRFAVGVNVPFVRTHTTISSNVNPGGTNGNFGLNPANAALSGTSSAAAALARNGAVQNNLTAAATALRTAGAAALADSITRFAAGLASVYGNGTKAGANVVPLLGSDAQTAVVRELGHYAARAQAAGVALDSTTVPYPAQARIGFPGFTNALSDSSFGLASTNSLLGGFRRSVGDVELTGMFQWLNTFGDSADSRAAVRARVAPTGLRVRSTIVGGFRFGTGHGEIPGVLLDVPPATGANAILARSITDVVFTRSLSVSGSVRFAAPLGDTQRLRVPVSLDSGYVPLYRERDVGRTLGRDVQVELDPRYARGESFAVWGQALLRAHQADRYTGQYTATAAETGGTPVAFDASTLGEGTAQREARVGLGLAYSTVAAWARGRARLPVEISYLHAVTAAGSGATTPRLSSDVLSLRVFAGLRGR